MNKIHVEGIIYFIVQYLSARKISLNINICKKKKKNKQKPETMKKAEFRGSFEVA